MRLIGSSKVGMATAITNCLASLVEHDDDRSPDNEYVDIEDRQRRPLFFVGALV